MMRPRLACFVIVVVTLLAPVAAHAQGPPYQGTNTWEEEDPPGLLGGHADAKASADAASGAVAVSAVSESAPLTSPWAIAEAEVFRIAPAATGARLRVRATFVVPTTGENAPRTSAEPNSNLSPVVGFGGNAVVSVRLGVDLRRCEEGSCGAISPPHYEFHLLACEDPELRCSNPGIVTIEQLVTLSGEEVNAVRASAGMRAYSIPEGLALVSASGAGQVTEISIERLA